MNSFWWYIFVSVLALACPPLALLLLWLTEK